MLRKNVLIAAAARGGSRSAPENALSTFTIRCRGGVVLFFTQLSAGYRGSPRSRMMHEASLLITVGERSTARIRQGQTAAVTLPCCAGSGELFSRGGRKRLYWRCLADHQAGSCRRLVPYPGRRTYFNLSIQVQQAAAVLAGGGTPKLASGTLGKCVRFSNPAFYAHLADRSSVLQQAVVPFTGANFAEAGRGRESHSSRGAGSEYARGLPDTHRSSAKVKSRLRVSVNPYRWPAAVY